MISSLDSRPYPEAAPHSIRQSLRDLVASAVLVTAVALGICLFPVPRAHAQDRTELRIGYQKSASLFVLQKAQGTLEKRLAPLKASVKWVEFPAGPELLEGLNLGAPDAEALLVPRNSAIRSVADLRGKRIALDKGSNVHHLAF